MLKNWTSIDRRILLLGYALVVAALWIVGHRHGISMSPDARAYWEGSISLLEGRGLQRANGDAITAWPPGYPLLLAVCQSFAGVSGRTLIATTGLLAGATAYGWGHLIEYIRAASDTRTASRWMTPFTVALHGFVAAFVLGSIHYPWAHTLQLALSPWLIILCVGVTHHEGAQWGRWFAIGAVLFLLLLTHNTSVAFLLPIAVIIAHLDSRPRHKLAVGILVAVVSVVPWYVVRVALGQTGHHPVGWDNGRWGLLTYLQQTLAGIAEFFATRRLASSDRALQVLGFCIACACVTVVVRSRAYRGLGNVTDQRRPDDRTRVARDNESRGRLRSASAAVGGGQYHAAGGDARA